MTINMHNYRFDFGTAGSLMLRMLLFFSLILSAASLWAFDLESLSTMEDDSFPLSGTVYRKDGVLPELDLLPDMAGSDALQRRFEQYNPEITVQKLYRIALPPSYSSSLGESSSSGESSTAVNSLVAVRFFTDVVNAFGNPETQVGYTYHSATRDKDIVLFEKSFISDQRGRRQDPFTITAKEIPLSMAYYQYVDEANFSGTVLRQQLEVTTDYLSFRSTNTQRMWFTIIPILGPEGTRNEMMMTIHDRWLYVYNCTQLSKVPVAKKIGFPVHLPSMFGKRMDVMAQWLKDQLE